MRLFTIGLVATSILISGCAVTQDGVKVPGGQGPDKAQVDDFLKRNQRGDTTTSAGTMPGKSESVAKEVEKAVLKEGAKKLHSNQIDRIAGLRVIYVGNVMSFNGYSKEQRSQGYDAYEGRMKEAGLPVAFTKDWYVNNSVGFVNVVYSGMLGFNQVMRAELTGELKQEITFPSPMSTLLFGTTGDLVAAEDIGTKGTWITHLLCSKKNSDFDECSKQYVAGIFQGVDGRQINAKLKTIDNGSKIDLATYKKL